MRRPRVRELIWESRNYQQATILLPSGGRSWEGNLEPAKWFSTPNIWGCLQFWEGVRRLFFKSWWIELSTSLKGGKKNLLQRRVGRFSQGRIPSYTMSCFLFPILLFCEEIKKVVARFYWGSTPEAQKIHWLSWEKISRSKERGGLGFCEMFFFNMAMVAKQYWRLLHNSKSLAAQILKARYLGVILQQQPWGFNLVICGVAF